MDADIKEIGSCPKSDLSNHLIGKAGAHDKRWVACAAAQIDEPSLGQNQDRIATGKRVAINLRLNLDLANALCFFQPRDVDLKIEVADVTDNGVILHLCKVLAANHISAASGCYKDLAPGGRLFHRGDFVSFHCGLQGIDRVDFGDNHSGPE